MSPAWVFLIFFLFQSAHALYESQDLYIGARAQAMGGAFVAVADDEQAIFLNPAGIALLKPAVHYITLDIEGSKDSYSHFGEVKDALKDFGLNSMNALMGNNIYGRAQFTPSISFPFLSAALITDSQFAMYPRNPAIPTVTAGFQQTNGIQLATGFSLFNKRSTSRKRAQLLMGIGAKMLWRRGGIREFTSLELANMSGSDTEGLISAVGGKTYRMGIGFDVGTLWIQPVSKQVNFQMGLAWRNIEDIKFGSNPSIPKQSGNLAAGLSFVVEMGLARMIASYEMDYLQIGSMDSRKKQHLGAEIAFPVLSLYGGINQTYATYGMGVNLGVFKFFAYSYAEELGILALQDSDRRYSLRLDFSMPL